MCVCVCVCVCVCDHITLLVVRGTHLCPADDLAVGLELRAMEDLDAGDGLHRLPIDWADDSKTRM